MLLKDLLHKVDVLQIEGDLEIEILNIHFDSRKIQEKSLFVAINGEQVDGHKYINTAVRDGSVAVIVEYLNDDFIQNGVTYIMVKDSRNTLALIASNFYNNPSERIYLIGVTGTNGKTTVVSLLHQLFNLLNIKAGMLSTIYNKVDKDIIPATHTTPDPLQINYLIDRMVRSGCKYCVMEVSSHALAQLRVTGLFFSAGIFSNITQDHLDYHGTFSEYISVKKTFFDSLTNKAFALTNLDDKNGLKMLEHTKARKLSYSLKSLSDYHCRILETRIDGMLININNQEIWVNLIGEFNAYNLLSVYAIAHQLGFVESEIFRALSMLISPEGRLQFVKSDKNITGVVDYAHTDDALKNVLNTIHQIKSNKQNIITVVGCGGDRDVTKRPLIASVACKLSKHVIFTTDNPRSEDPQEIINEMLAGIDDVQKNKVLVITDRKQAIKTSCSIAKENDIVLIAGKGHEKFQEFQDTKIEFDDLFELKKSLNIK